MASSVASPLDISADAELGRTKPNNTIVIEDEDFNIKQTAVYKAGGILCHICSTIFDRKKAFVAHYVGRKAHETDILYTCVSCKKKFSEYSLFRSHCYLAHAIKNKFQCQHCKKNFSKSSALKSHISLIHEFKCNVCNEKFESKQELETHKKILHKSDKNVPPYKCSMCPTIIDTLDKCKLHINKHCEMKYPCPICETLLSDKQPAIEHLMIHFTDEQAPPIPTTEETSRLESSIDVLGGILCCHCDYIFHNRAEIDSHFAELHSDKAISYSCNVCLESFEKYHVFGDHCYNHYSKGRFACDVCYKTFPRLSLLVMHMEMFHMQCSEEKPFHCKDCGRGFYTVLRLHEHRRLVHGEEETMYRCNRPNCTDTFGKPRELIQHIAVHGSALDRWCRRCGLHLPALADAERHLAVHRRAACPCPVCAREYHERYQLVKHAASHFERVFHVCAVCGKAYTGRHRLIEHMKVHASRPADHTCSHCGKSFRSQLALSQHENTHTGRKPFSCTVCPKTFASYPNWRKHMTRVHGLPSTVVRDIYLQTYKITSHATQTSPSKAESGIESAGSELSDVYVFASDDSSDINDWKTHKKEEPVNNINDSPNAMSIADTVRSCIDALEHNIDEKCDLKPTPETQIDFNMSNNPDDESDIRAIVEHIDALSGEMPTIEQNEHPEYTHLMPVDHQMFTAVPEALQWVPALPPAAGLQAEYGPDFTAEAVSLEDHLPHINPLLTIKPDDSMYVPTLNNFEVAEYKQVHGTEPAQLDWPPPIINKIYQYEEKDDANRIYSIYY